MNQQAAVITVDGPSGSGKGTVCSRIATTLGWNLLDSGAIYRLLALAAIHHHVELDNEEALATLAAHLDIQFICEEGSITVILEGEDVSRELRREEVGSAASRVAGFPRVREALLRRQRAFRTAPGLIADGRDMGTIVFPDAEVKIFLDASVEERAQRRYNQLQEKGFDASLEHLLNEIQARDERDRNRAVAPLKPADDALVIDSTDLSINQVVEQIMAHAQSVITR